MTKQKLARARKKSAGSKRNRQRALPLPNAIAWTIPDYQALGGPGKTSIYQLGKSGALKLFVDGAGRTMVDGDSGRALLGIKETETT
jgi:hypothetical protein